MIQVDIYKVMLENVGVTDITSVRIYPLELPPNAIVPAVVYTVNDIAPIKSLDGESGLDNGTIEIVCWAKIYKTAHLLAAAIRSAFSESGIGVMTGNMQDIRDEETRNYGVVMNMNGWSESSVDRSVIMEQTGFTGNGTSTEFTLPKFKSGSLLVFFNGRLAKKGLESNSEGAYYEKSTLDGFVFRIAPKGGEYKDELLAFYAKV